MTAVAAEETAAAGTSAAGTAAGTAAAGTAAALCGHEALAQGIEALNRASAGSAVLLDPTGKAAASSAAAFETPQVQQEGEKRAGVPASPNHLLDPPS